MSERCAPEYIRMHRLVRDNFIYEFMRIGTEVTPFNTLGHIAGVHYVATYMARQLKSAGISDAYIAKHDCPPLTAQEKNEIDAFWAEYGVKILNYEP